MTSYRAPLPYHERKYSWEEPDVMPQGRANDDYLRGHSLAAGYSVDSGRLPCDRYEDYLENGRRDCVEYRDDNPHLREREGNYRRFEREDRKPPPLLDFRRNAESARDLYPDPSRESRFYDTLHEYIREQRELMNTDYVRREKEPGQRSLLDLKPLIYEDDRSRDYDRSRGFLPEERSRDNGHRSRHDASDDGYRYAYERRSRMEELDYRDGVDPRRHDYHRQPTRNDPHYQRDSRNDKRDDDILYDYRDRHRRPSPPERVRGRRDREYSYVDRGKYPISSRMVHNERPTRSDLREEPPRGANRGEPRFKRERRSPREEYAPYPSSETRRPRGGPRPSVSPGVASKAYSHDNSPARPSPTSSARLTRQEKYPKRKMAMHEMNETKRRKCDGRQTKGSPKKQETPSTELITRDQFLSRDVFSSKDHSSRVAEDKNTKTKDLGSRDSTSSRHRGERDLRHELTESRAAASGTKSPYLGDSSDLEERSSTASSTRIIDHEPSALRSIVQVPKQKSKEPDKSRSKNKEVGVYSDSAQTPDPVIKPHAKQVSTPSSDEPLPGNTAPGQPVRTLEVLKRKVSICSIRAPSPLLGAAEKPKVELPADDLRLLIMSRRLRQSEETSASLDDDLKHKNEETALIPQTEHPQCQVSNQSQGSADAMVELSYSDPEGSANEDSAPPSPEGHACRTVVMRRQVILDYGHERGLPRTSHPSPEKEKEKEKKMDKENESSGTTPNGVEVVSEGVTNPPVLTNHPLYKEEDSKILTTVEVVDNSFESLDGQAADESQTSEESNRDVNSYDVEQSFYGSTDGTTSSVVYKQKYGYLQQIEDALIQNYNGPSLVDKNQVMKENVVGVQEGEYFEESNGAWATSSGHCGTEQQTYQEEENTLGPQEDEQPSTSHYHQEFSQEDGHCRGESDAVREDHSYYSGEEQHIPPYEQEYSQEHGYDTEVGHDLTENPANYNGEEQHIPHHEQEYSHEPGYSTEAGHDLREEPADYNGEEQHIAHFEQEYSQELGYSTEAGHDLREEPADYNGEEQHIAHFEQEYSQELGYSTEAGHDLREEPADYNGEEQQIQLFEQQYSPELGYDTEAGHDGIENPADYNGEEQHIAHHEQEYSQVIGYDTEAGHEQIENPADYNGEVQHIAHHGQEYSQELGYDTEAGHNLIENPADYNGEVQHIAHHEQEYSQELGYDTEAGHNLIENPTDYNGEEQQIPQYEPQEYFQEPGYGVGECDVVRETAAENYNEDHRPSQELQHPRNKSESARVGRPEHDDEEQNFSRYEQEYFHYHTEENGHARENPPGNHRDGQPISHYEQELYQELGVSLQESSAVKEGHTEFYEDSSYPKYDRQSYLERDYFQEESDALRNNSLEEKQQSVSHSKQGYSLELGSYNDENDDVEENTTESYGEQQPFSHYEKGFSPKVSQEDVSDEIKQNCPEIHEEDQQVLHKEREEKYSGTDEDNESTLISFQEENGDNEPESFSELEQFAGMSDSVSEGFSDLSEQDDLSGDSEEESYETGDDDESVSSGEESFQSATGEVKFCETKYSYKQHENAVSERQHSSYDKASFSGYKGNDGAECPLVTSTHQYERAREKDEYNDDSEEETTPEMSNGFDVILALDSVDYDASDDDMKHANSDDGRGLFRRDEVAGASNPQDEEEIPKVHGHVFSYEMDALGSDDAKGRHDVIGKHDVIGTNIAKIENQDRIQNHAAAEKSTSEFIPSIDKEDLQQNKENPPDENLATNVNDECSASECNWMDEDLDTSKDDVNQGDGTAAKDSGGAISSDSSYKYSKSGIPGDALDMSTEESHQTEPNLINCFAANEKCQESDGCEIQCLALNVSACDNGETEAQKSQPPDLNWDSVSKYDPDLPPKDYDSDHASENVEQQQTNLSTELINKRSGSEYEPALPKKNRTCVNEHDGHELLKVNHCTDHLYRSSGSEYDPTLPTKDYGTLTGHKSHADVQDVLNMSSASSEYDPSLPTKDYGNMETKYDDDDDNGMRQSDHSADILNASTSSGSEYDPAIPTKDHVRPQDSHVVIDSQELRNLADHYKSSSSEYDPNASTKSCDVTMEEDDHNDGAFQELPRVIDNRSDSRFTVCIPEENSDVAHEQDDRNDDVIEELRHPDLGKNSDSKMDLHIPTNECAATNEQDCLCQNVTQEACHPVHCGKSNCSVHIVMKNVRNEQDYQRDDVIHDDTSSGSKNVLISKNDCDVANEQIYRGDVIQHLRSSVGNKPNGSAQTNIHIPTTDVTKEQRHSSDDVICDIRSSDSETDCQVVTKHCEVEFAQNNHSDDVIPVSNINESIVSQSTDSEIPDEHSCQDDTQELRQPDLNEIPGDEPPFHNISNPDQVMEAAYPRTITEKVCPHQSLTESNAIPVERKAPDAQECIPVTCDSGATSLCSGSSYELVREEDCRVLGATAEIFLPSDIDANHICIYECVDFQLLCVHEQGSKQLYHDSQTVRDSRQEDLPSDEMTPGNNQGWVNSTVAAPILDEECVIQERRVVQNQVNLICSSTSDEDQISSQEDNSCSHPNAVEATSQNAFVCESVEHRDPVEGENPNTITLPQNITGMSQKACSSREENTKEIDDPDLLYPDEVQYFEGEQPIGKSENTGKAKTSSKNISAEDLSDETYGSERCGSSNDSTGETSLYSTETNSSEVGSSTSQSELMLKLRQEFDRWTQNNGQPGDDYIFSETNYSCSSDLTDGVHQAQPYDPECASLNQASFSDMSSDGVHQAQPYDPECASLNQASFSDMSSDGVHQAQPYDPECASLNQASFSDMSSDGVHQAQPYDPESASLTEVSFSDMSLETPSSSSHVSPRSSRVSANVSLKNQVAVPTVRTSSSQLSLGSSSASARVPYIHEGSDLKSRKPYDPANCFMDVDTFSELSGMSPDTPSSSAVEYAATEADTTLVGVADDDSAPYTPEAYSRSPENNSEPYSPEAYSPVLSLSGDESDPELFSCRYMDDASTPYNPVSHCPADINIISGASGNEADNEVSTGLSSPEFSTNERRNLSLKLKKPSAQKLRWSYVGNSSLDKVSSNDDACQKNQEVYSPQSFVPLSKPAAGGKSSSKKSSRLHSRSKRDDVEHRKQQKGVPKNKERSAENDKPCASRKSLPSSSKQSERTLGKEQKSKEEHKTTESKRKPLKSLVTVVSTNQKAKKDQVKEKVERHAGTKAKKNSGSKDHNSKAIPKEKESVKRGAVSARNETETTQERNTPPLKKPKLSSQSTIPRSAGTNTTQHHKKKPSERKNRRQEKFKKPVSPEKCEGRRRSSKRAKEEKSARKSSEVKRKGCDEAGSSSTVLDELKTMMKDMRKGAKSPESSTATKNPTSKAKETLDELHLLDEGHELLELALEESINRSKTDKSLSAKGSLNLAEKVEKIKRKLAETEEMSGNKKNHLTQGVKPSEQEGQEQLTYCLDSPDDKRSEKGIKASSDASLDTLKAPDQNSPIRLMNDNCKSMELAVKCSGGEQDAITLGVVTGSNKTDKGLGRESTIGVSFQEKKSARKNDCGWVTIDNKGVPGNKTVVSSAIEKLEVHSAPVSELRLTGVQEAVDEPMIVVSSENGKRMNKHDGQASDKENSFTTSANPDSAMSEETDKIVIADKSTSTIKDNESNNVGEHDQKTRETSDSLNVAKEMDRESKINSRKGHHQEIPAEDSCKVSEEVTNTTLSAYSVISSPTSKYLSQGKSSLKLCGQDSEMPGRQIPEDKAAKPVIADDGVGEVQIDRLTKDQDEQARRGQGNEKIELDQDKDDWSKERLPNMDKQDSEKNAAHQTNTDWSTSISDMTTALCTGTANAEKLNMAVTGVENSIAEQKNEKTDDQNTDSSPNNAEQGATCLPTIQESRTNKENQFVINAFGATIEKDVTSPYRDNDAVGGCSSKQGVAKSLATPCGKASTPRVQAKADVSSTPSGVPCAQMVHVAEDDSASPAKLSTSKGDGLSTPIGVEVEGARVAISSTSVGPSAPKKSINGKQACMDGNAQDSEGGISSGQSIEEGKDVKSEISLEEYIEAHLQQGLSLPDISGSKVPSEAMPSLPPISFNSPTVTPNVSHSSSASRSKLPLSSSAIPFQKTDLSPVLSKLEKGSRLSSETSKKTPPASSAREERSDQESPRMDMVRSFTAEYEKKIIAILQKRVDVEKAYREECAKIVNAVKALARKKKNMERELQDVLQTSLREISQKYISELQRFVRNETI